MPESDNNRIRTRHVHSCLSVGVLFTYAVCFVQLRNRLNVQREQLLKAQQNSLLVRHQHKDSVIQNIAEMQSVSRQQPQRSTHTSKRHKTARTNGKPVPYVTEVDKKLVSETHSTVDTVSSRAPTVCQPLTLQPTASVHRSVSSFDHKAEPFSHRMTRDVSGHAANSVSPRTANLVNDSIGTQSRQSGSLPLKPAAVKNISAGDTCEVDYNSSAKRSSTVSDFSGSNLPVHSLATAVSYTHLTLPTILRV